MECFLPSRHIALYLIITAFKYEWLRCDHISHTRKGAELSGQTYGKVSLTASVLSRNSLPRATPALKLAEENPTLPSPHAVSPILAGLFQETEPFTQLSVSSPCCHCRETSGTNTSAYLANRGG